VLCGEPTLMWILFLDEHHHGDGNSRDLQHIGLSDYSTSNIVLDLVIKIIVHFHIDFTSRFLKQI